MAGTRSKARRASTPLSSPPSSPALSPQPSPTPERAASPSASSHPESPYESSDSDDDFDSDHEEHCSRHTSELATHCNGLTYARKKCSYRAKIFEEGFFPICRTHVWQQKQAGRCQAIEKCGRLCNRLAAYTPPYFLCAKHEGGTNTLPCYIMRLPTELRLMIFRYLLPDSVGAIYFDSRQTAVLRVNRQFYEEASAIVYNELNFQAVVHPTIIDILRTRLTREPSSVLSKDLTETHLQAGARRIRHLEVEVNFGDCHGKFKGIGVSGITHEEYELYQVRDTVRKLVELLLPQSREPRIGALKQLKVKPAPSSKQHWRSDEAIAATFFVLEPFLALGPIEDVALIAPPRPANHSWRYSGAVVIIGELHKDEEYRRLRKQWLRSMKGSVSFSITHKPRNTTAAIATAYSRIEDFARLIYGQDSAQFSGDYLYIKRCHASSKYGWTSSSFQGIERVLHIARVAFEDGDLKQLHEIHEAIMRRWVKAHQQQQQALAAVAATVSNMFDADISNRDGYDANAFDFDEVAPVQATVKSNETWPELNVKSVVLKLKEPGVSFREEGVRLIVRIDGKEQVHLKTPTIVRQLRVHKRTP